MNKNYKHTKFLYKNNPKAVEYLLQYPKKIDWYGFSENTPICVEDKEKIFMLRNIFF